ncbi:ribosome maturation factor RimP [Aliarcobacter skirrowii]|uniref:Ribosome maturation factor RimP n=1 Tax=Aliarcobacter skirrowii TaxID=28200 RepID=A0A2U2C2X3_9BACT|nr:ribosome maturation factor RimP [Aliarcobacter skirrowii]MDX4057883.1 ribosome maturation factor RimP [Aliarcobacter skirrowii]MDX4070391.1 ribosome maturation factor RimP [Aliarcobacter skirrowii]PWE22735.1 ribosome maturation factor RimP [Aliarcobacter skirrowii]PWE23389.1 ribosome maturation factor RimP [Aliarcobacter skirrowii]PWE26020.1 ribosome maturation factor RimP [Aliarcobacter skirrowii]
MNLEEQIKLIVENSGLNLYDIVTTKEHDRNIFRIIVTSKDGVNLDKCAEISRVISPLLDVEEPMGGKYNLEVSSPGIERKLKKIEHFIASVGEKVKVKNIDTEVFKGELIFADENKIVVKTDNLEVEIAHNDILSAATYFEW